MAQTGYTPIQLYYSSTTTNVPLAANLANGELAINITDGKLFYKDNAAAVQVIGWKTVPTSAGGTGLTSYTAGDTVYYASGTTLTKLAIGTAYQAFQVNAGATAPSWQPSATSVLTAQGDLLYASSANTLARLAKDANATRYLANTGTTNNPAWAQINLTNGVTGTLPVGNGGTGLTTVTANYVPYGNGANAFQTSGNFQFNGTQLTISGPNTNYTPNYTIGMYKATSNVGLLVNCDNGYNAYVNFSSYGGKNSFGYNYGSSAYQWCVGVDGLGSGINLQLSSAGLLLAGGATSALINESTFGLTSAANTMTAHTSDAGSNPMLVWNGGTTGTRPLISFYTGTPYSGLGGITTNGSTITYGGTSDYRLKENVQPLTGALEKIAKLKPCSFVWKNTGIQDDGFIAHELQEVHPNAVVGEKDGTKQEVYEITPAVKDDNGEIITAAVTATRTVDVYQQIDTSFLVATLTAAIQELKAEFDAYKATNSHTTS